MRLRKYLQGLRRKITTPLRLRLKKLGRSKFSTVQIASSASAEQKIVLEQTSIAQQSIALPNEQVASLPKEELPQSELAAKAPPAVDGGVATAVMEPSTLPKEGTVAAPVLAAPVALSPTIDGDTTKLFLAFLKASQRPVIEPSRSFQAFSLGDGRALVAHPTAGFLYSDTSNVKVLPKMVMGIYQEQATIAIEREFANGDCVIQLEAGQGYHTLTLASVVGETGRVLAIENRAVELAILRTNLDAHSLENRVSICEISNRDVFPYLQFLGTYRTIAGVVASADVEIPEAWLRGLTEFFSRSPRTIFVDGSTTLSFDEYLLIRKQRLSRERRAA